MYVWIPRYAYSITTNYRTSGTTGGTVEIKFLKGTTNTASDGTTTWDNVSGQGKWNIHPAFINNVDMGGWDSELTGVWVAKFEASSKEGNANTEAGDSVTTKTVQIKPNVASWRYITTGNSYTNCLNMKTSLNSHMMKNSEWGAVAYLTQSKYGRNGTEVTINSSSTYLTGGGNYVSNIAQSTTGNVYGIYDLNGGAWERTASYVANTNSNLTTYGSSFASIDSNPSSTREVTVYKMGTSDTQTLNYSANSGIYGDAVYETSSSYSGSNSWFSDYSSFPYSTSPFFFRGGSYGSGSLAGAFAFGGTSGYEDSYVGFRPVLAL